MSGNDAVPRFPTAPQAIRQVLELAAAAVFAIAVYEAVVASALAIRPGLTDSWILLLWMTAATISGLGLNRVRHLTGAGVRRVWPASAGPGHALASVAAVVSADGTAAEAYDAVASLLAAGTGAGSVQVWVAEPDGRLRRAGSSGPPGIDETAIHGTGSVADLNALRRLPGADHVEPVADLDALRRLPGADHVEPVADAEGPLGALVLRAPTRRPLTASDRRLAADAAGPAALLLRNRRLDADLEDALEREREQALSLARSRHRVVLARETARERLGSEIQRRVGHSLAACAEGVDTLLAARGEHSDTEGRRDRILRELTARVDAAIVDFREIVHGVYPATLTDHGLAPSLDNLVAGLPWPASFRAPADLPRLDRRLETSVYFCLAMTVGALRDGQSAPGTSWRARHLDLELSLDGTAPPVLTARLSVQLEPQPTVADRPAVAEFFDTDTLDAIGDRVAAMQGESEVTVDAAEIGLTLSIPASASGATPGSEERPS